MNDFGWKERLGLTEQWVAPTFQGFATADEETMVADIKLSLKKTN